jgi:apolipoprotein N-acyltransferase
MRGAGWAAGLASSAGLMAVALDSSAFWWLGWVTLIPLFLAIRLLRPVVALWAGGFWGLSLFVISSLIGSSAIPLTPTALFFLAVIPSLYTCVGAAVTRRKGFHPLLLGLGWAGVEIALTPLALRNGLLAGTIGSSGWVLSLGKLGGYVLVAFLVAFANAVILSLLAGVGGLARSHRILSLPHETRQTLRFVEDLVFSSQFLELVHPRPPPLCFGSTTEA